MFFNSLQERPRDSKPANASEDVHPPHFSCSRVDRPMRCHSDRLAGLIADQIHAQWRVWWVRGPRRAGIVQVGVQVASFFRSFPKQYQSVVSLRIDFTDVKLRDSHLRGLTFELSRPRRQVL